MPERNAAAASASYLRPIVHRRDPAFDVGAWRSLSRAPGFVAIAVLALAIRKPMHMLNQPQLAQANAEPSPDGDAPTGDDAR